MSSLAKKMLLSLDDLMILTTDSRILTPDS